MAVFDGMRPGEIFAVQVGKVGASSVVVEKRVYGTDIDTSKGRKGKDTSRTVGLSPGSIADINRWKLYIGEQSESAYLFCSETGVTPRRPNNRWKRKIRPRLKQVGLGWVNFQVLRRTNASLSRKAKVDDKVSADQRGHGLGVSLGVYAFSDLDQKIEAVTKLESAVIGASDEDDFEFVASGKRHPKADSGKETEYGRELRSLLCCLSIWSGRRESNSQPTAWKAVTLPLSYSRPLAEAARRAALETFLF
jgi:hypothetical protein